MFLCALPYFSSGLDFCVLTPLLLSAAGSASGRKVDGRRDACLHSVREDGRVRKHARFASAVSSRFPSGGISAIMCFLWLSSVHSYQMTFVLNFLIVPFLFLLRFAMFFPERGKRSVPYMRLPAYFPVAFVERFPVSLFCFWCFSCFVFLFLVLFLFLFFCFWCFWCCSFVKPEWGKAGKQSFNNNALANQITERRRVPAILCCLWPIFL